MAACTEIEKDWSSRISPPIVRLIIGGARVEETKRFPRGWHAKKGEIGRAHV